MVQKNNFENKVRIWYDHNNFVEKLVFLRLFSTIDEIRVAKSQWSLLQVNGQQQKLDKM